MPIVIAHHLIWTAYGWWLPNDPRGSTSKHIVDSAIAELGPLHFGRKQIQPAGSDVGRFYDRAAQVLKHPLQQLSPAQFLTVAEAFGKIIERERYTCYACAIMPDHVHILIRKHKHLAEEMIENLKAESRDLLRQTQVVPENHPVWTGGGGWKVFLHHPDDIARTIPYIENNPVKIGLPRQRWAFVKPYDRWPLHEGHNPNSPYARGLRAAGRYP